MLALLRHGKRRQHRLYHKLHGEPVWESRIPALPGDGLVPEPARVTRVSNYGSLQKRESITIHARANTKRNRHCGGKTMTGRKSRKYRHSQFGSCVPQNVVQLVPLRRMLFATRHFAENQSTHAMEGSRHAQLPEHTIDLVRFYRCILEEYDGPVEAGKVRRASQSRYQR